MNTSSLANLMKAVVCRTIGIRGVFAALSMLAGLEMVTGRAQTANSGDAFLEPVVIRIGIAPGTWQGLNRNDATAAIATWTKCILSRRSMSIRVETTLFESTEELAAALETGTIDCASMLSDQFLALDVNLQSNEVFLGVNNQSVTDRYVLVVRQDSGIHDLAGLRGRKLLVQTSPRMGIALPWLDTSLAMQSLDSPEVLLSDIILIDKPSKTVLPVFFHQADAGLVSSNAFEIAGELNPQLRKELRVLAVSPEVVPALFFFRRGYSAVAQEQMEQAIVTLHESAAGLQVLTVFQCERMVKSPVSCFETTRQLLAQHASRRKGKLTPDGRYSAAQILNHEKP